MSHHYAGPDFGFPHGDAQLDLTDLYAFPKPGDDRESILIFNMHPSHTFDPQMPTTPVPFAPEALYELKIEERRRSRRYCVPIRLLAVHQRGAGGDAALVAGAQAAGTSDDGQVIVEGAPVLWIWRRGLRKLASTGSSQAGAVIPFSSTRWAP